jgi:hypothetical protein
MPSLNAYGNSRFRDPLEDQFDGRPKIANDRLLQALRREQKKTRPCQVCGNPVTSTRKGAKFCSKPCYNIARGAANVRRTT